MKLISVILLSCALACANTTPQCKKPTPVPVQPVQPTPVSPTPVTSTNNNVNQNTNTNNNTNSNTNNVSASASSNQSQQQSQNQSAVANGGKATSAINERGSVSVTAPTILSTGPCSGSSVAGGASGPVGGLSFGRSKVDAGCDARMNANEMFGIGSKLAGCKILIQQKNFKAAGVTLEDCMGTPAEPVAPVIQITPPPPSPSITVNIPVTVIEPTPAPIAPKVAPSVTKKAVVRHMRPDCQNELVRVCK